MNRCWHRPKKSWRTCDSVSVKSRALVPDLQAGINADELKCGLGLPGSAQPVEKAHPPLLHGERIHGKMNTKFLEDLATTRKHRGRLFSQRDRRKEYDSGFDHDAICRRVYQTIGYITRQTPHTHSCRSGSTFPRLQSFDDGIDLADHLGLPQVAVRMCLRNRHLLPLSQRDLLQALLDVEARVNALCIWESSLAVGRYLLAVSSNPFEGANDIDRNASGKDRRRWNADRVDPTRTDADDTSDLAIGPNIVSFG